MSGNPGFGFGSGGGSGGTPFGRCEINPAIRFGVRLFFSRSLFLQLLLNIEKTIYFFTLEFSNDNLNIGLPKAMMQPPFKTRFERYNY